jgi:hypothetical protein
VTFQKLTKDLIAFLQKSHNSTINSFKRMTF